MLRARPSRRNDPLLNTLSGNFVSGNRHELPVVLAGAGLRLRRLKPSQPPPTPRSAASLALDAVREPPLRLLDDGRFRTGSGAMRDLQGRAPGAELAAVADVLARAGSPPGHPLPAAGAARAAIARADGFRAGGRG